MGNHAPRGDEDCPESISDLPTGRETTDALATRREVPGRAGALGLLPISGPVGRGSAETNGPSPTGPPERPASEDVNLSLVFETRFDEGLTALARAEDGGYVLAGQSYAEGAGGKVWFVRTDARGDPLVKRSLDFPERYSDPKMYSYPEATDVAADDDGAVILGEAWAADVCWLRSVDADGDTCWLRDYSYSTSGRGYCRSLVRTTEGGYAWVARESVLHVVDADGESRWRRSYTCSRDSEQGGVPRIGNVVSLDDGGFLFAGILRTSLEESLVWVARVDQSGALLDDALFGGDGYHSVFDAVPTGDGGMALVG